MTNLFLRLFLPMTITASIVSFWHAYATGRDLELAVLLPSFVALIIGAVAERWLPYRRDWSRPRGDVTTDLASMALLFGMVDPLIKWAAPLALTAALARTPLADALAFFPTQWPFVLQVLLATLVVEFGSYWAHRWHHERPALWWLHALHHGSERLYTLNNFRFHPLNYLINYLLGFVPLLLIGVPPAVMYGYFALTLPVLMLQHANLPLRHGWLNHVFSTNEVHRWHHSNRATEGDSNFGRALVLWDQLFGTYRNQAGANDPAQVGLYAGSRYPARVSFGRQLASMLLPGCCRRPA